MKFKPINWGYHGAEKLNRDSRGLIVKTSNHFEATMACKQRGAAKVMVFSGGPECREYRFDMLHFYSRLEMDA